MCLVYILYSSRPKSPRSSLLPPSLPPSLPKHTHPDWSVGYPVILRQLLTSTKMVCRQEMEAAREEKSQRAKDRPEVCVEVTGENTTQAVRERRATGNGGQAVCIGTVRISLCLAVPPIICMSELIVLCT